MLLMAELCDPMSAFDKPKCVLVKSELPKIAHLSVFKIMSVKCHGEPEIHIQLYNYSTTTLSLWEIHIIAMRKKIGRIGSLLISQCQKYVIHSS
jgi:hypothetical protein